MGTIDDRVLPVGRVGVVEHVSVPLVEGLHVEKRLHLVGLGVQFELTTVSKHSHKMVPARDASQGRSRWYCGP